MKEYFLKILERNRDIFSSEEIKFINNNLELAVKIFRIGMIEKFNITMNQKNFILSFFIKNLQ